MFPPPTKPIRRTREFIFMRVLHIGKFYPPFAGGIEYFLADLLPALQRHGVTPAALVHAHAKPACPSSQAGIPIYRAPCYGRLLYAPLSPQFPFWLNRIIREFQPACLHLHLPNTSAFWALALPAARRLPWLIHWHADVVASQIEQRLAWAYRCYRPLEQRLLAASSGIIATSPPYLEASTALAPWHAKCHVIPLGLDPDRLAAPGAQALTGAETHWQDASFRLLAVGRLTYYKGYEVLLQALAELPGELSPTRLLIVGAGEQRRRLEHMIQRLQLTKQVTLLGFQNEETLHALLTSSDVLCLPSLERTEAFGLVLLEAMRFGKPVLASAIPGSGVAWVVAQGQHGILVEAGQVRALAEGLMRLQQDPHGRQALGQRGARRLAETFHIDRIAAQIARLYATLGQR